MIGPRVERILLQIVRIAILLVIAGGTSHAAHLKSTYFEYHPLAASSAFVDDDMAYISAPDGIRAYDIERPNSPKLLGFYELPIANDIKVEGKYAFVVGGGIQEEKGYLKILDISSPAKIRLVREIPLAHGSVGVEVTKKYAYVSGLDAGLFIIDISNKDSPKLVRTVEFPRHENPMAIAKIVGRIRKGPKKFPIILGRTWWTHVEDGFVYVCDESTGLHVLDISNPKEPKELGSIINEFMRGSKNLAAEAFNDIDVRNNIGYVALDNGGMLIVDLKDKRRPTMLHHYNPWKGTNWATSPGHMVKIKVVENIAYVTAGEEGLYVMDVKDPKKPTLMEKQAVRSDVGSAWGLFVGEGLVFVTYIGVDPGSKRKGLKGGWEIFRVVDPLP